MAEAGVRKRSVEVIPVPNGETSDVIPSSSTTGSCGREPLGEHIEEAPMSLGNFVARTVGDFKTLILQVRHARRLLVRQVLSASTETGTSMFAVDRRLIAVLSDAERILSDGLDDSFRRKFELDNCDDSGSATVIHMHIKDEVFSLRKDLAYFHWVHSQPYHDAQYGYQNRLSNFLYELTVYHPVDKDTFIEELAKLMRFLQVALRGGKIDFITDWDGTMKNYASQYTTCLQPAFSAVIISQFVKRHTELAAILTAGPLRNPGILDLTAMPQQGVIRFGGSWGREWLWDDDATRTNYDNCDSPSAQRNLDLLAERITTLLSGERFHEFAMVGSGFQRKVDRLSLGVQSVCNSVSKKEMHSYLHAIKESLRAVDPDGIIFELHCDPHHTMDVEVVLKNIDEDALTTKEHDSASTDKKPPCVWNKGNGVGYLLSNLGLSQFTRNVLVCGDTMGDVPMVEFVRSANIDPDRVFCLMVNPSEALRDKTEELMGVDRCCFIGCPEVAHAAFALASCEGGLDSHFRLLRASQAGESLLGVLKQHDKLA